MIRNETKKSATTNAVLAAILAIATFAFAVTAEANEQVLVGDSFASGAEAAAEANLKIANANAAGCKAISIGGYGLGGGEFGKEIGIPVLLECPPGVDLLPNGQASVRVRSKTIGGTTYYEVDFTKGQTARSVCSSVGRQPSYFAYGSNVCAQFNPGANRYRLSAGDRGAAFCSGKETGVCSWAPNSCIECPSCKNGIGLDEDGSHLYSKMYVVCR